MRKGAFLLSIAALTTVISSAKADFGEADFPIEMFGNSPKSYHDVWCRKIKNKCRVRFQGSAMWVEGEGGIQSSQFIRYRYDSDQYYGFLLEGITDHYNYVTYKSQNGNEKEALFLLRNSKAQAEFTRAFLRWKEQKSVPIPNYRSPASQGPQDSPAKENGLNPYKNPPIIDWSIKTTPKQKD